MKKLSWLIIALVPASFGLIALTNAEDSVVWTLIVIGAICCLAGAFGLLEGVIKNVWLLPVVAIFLGAMFFAMDACIAIFVGCSYSSGHF